VVAVSVWIRLGTPMQAAPFPDDCSVDCTPTSSCDWVCYTSRDNWLNGYGTTCGAWGECNVSGGGGGNCGNGICDSGETCDSCPQDCYASCGTCGDGNCAANEYGGAGSGHPPPSGCDAQHDWCTYCPQDCNGACSQYFCDPQVCDYDGTHGLSNQCMPCTSDVQCAYNDEYCAFDGNCYVSAHCDTQADCTQAL